MLQPIVVLDPGHGGRGRVGGSSANNATGPNGLLEKDLTLDLARRVPALLAGVADVSLTRDRDVNLALTDRARIARDRHAALFLSVHLNGFADPGVDGTEVWVSRQASDASRSFAKRMLSHLSEATGVRNRGVRESDLGVLLPDRHDPHTGACLAEISFLTNPEQARKLNEEKYRQRIAEAMAAAIREQLPLAKAQGHGLGYGNGFDTEYGQAFDAPDKADWISLEFENIKKIKGSSEEQAFFLTGGGSNDQRAHFTVKISNTHSFSTAHSIIAPVLFVRLAKNIGGDSWQTIPLEKQEAGKNFLRMQENWILSPGNSRTFNIAIKKETLEAAYKAYPQNPFAFLRMELEARPHMQAGRKQVVRQAKQLRFALVKPVEMLSDSIQFEKRVALSDPQFRDKYATLIWSKRNDTATSKPSEIKFSIVSTVAETNENETTESHQVTRTDTETKKLEVSGKIGFGLGDLAKIGKTLTGELGVTFSKEWSTSLADQYSTALRTLRQSMQSTAVSRELTFEIPATAAGKTVNLYIVPVFKLYKSKVVRFEGPDVNGQATRRVVESLPLMLFDGWQELTPEVIDTQKTTQPTKVPAAKLPAPASGQSFYTSDALDVNMEPLVITVSEKRRAQLLQKAGWKQVNISVTVKNFLGQPLMEHKLLAEFKSPGVAAVAEGGDVSGGAVNLSKVWLKPEGTVRLMAVSTDKPGLVPTGVIHYRIPDKGSLKFEAVQEATEVSVTAESSQEAAEKSGVKGSVGVDFKVAQVGGEVSSEIERKKGTSRSVTWKVTLPTSTLNIKQL